MSYLGHRFCGSPREWVRSQEASWGGEGAFMTTWRRENTSEDSEDGFQAIPACLGRVMSQCSKVFEVGPR